MSMRTTLAMRLILRSRLESSPATKGSRSAAGWQFLKRGQASGLSLPELKQRLLLAAMEQTPDPALYKRLCGAANQAAELAWATSTPSASFPAFFQRLVEAAGGRMPA